MKSGKILFIIFILFLFTAADHAEAVEYRRFGQDYRSLAMGNTGIASANTSAALFYNPAAMANIFSWWVDFPVVQVTYSDDGATLLDIATEPGAFDLENQDAIQDFMEEYIGLNPYYKLIAGTNGFMNLLKTGLTIGANYTYDGTLEFEVRNPSLPEINAFFRLDLIQQAGISVPIGLGKLILGFTYKTVERTENIFTYSTNDLINDNPFPDLAGDGVTGSGSGYDIGFLYRTATPYRLMIGGVYRKEIPLGDATKIPEEIALGMSSQLDFSIFRLVVAVDWRDMTNQEGSEGDTSLNRRFHYGMELGVLPIDKSASWLSIRTGYNQGYLSTGAEINLRRNMVVGYTKYVEETGEFAGQKPSSRTTYYVSFGF